MSIEFPGICLRMRKWAVIVLPLLAYLCLLTGAQPCAAQQNGKEPTFNIEGFLVDGNTLLAAEEVQDALEDLTGRDKSSSDVEVARETLEKLYHSKGYPTVFVNIPEQRVTEGIVRLEVTESKITKVAVKGNRYVTMEKVLNSLPSMKTGAVLHVPEAQKEFGKVNQNPDMKATPSLSPGQTAGTVEAELKVEDKLPLHASLELSNRSSPNTSSLRINAVLHYDNLWQRDHSVSLQYQTSPENVNEVQVIAASYSLPAPWNPEHVLVLAGIWNSSDTAFGEGFTAVGNGSMFQLRYIVPLPAMSNYTHNIAIGIDYKDFEDITGLGDLDEIKSPVTYLPLSFQYSSYLADPLGMTHFSAGLHMAFRGLITEESQLQAKRTNSQGNFLYATAGIERLQDLVAGSKLFARVDGQISDTALISNEQYAGGGMESVRGYRESEVFGDSAIHTSIELLAPELLESRPFARGKLKLTPFAFCDFAKLYLQDPLAGENQEATLLGAGLGARGTYGKNWEYETVWAIALAGTEHTNEGASRIHFRLKYLY